MPPLEAGSTRIQLCGVLKADIEGRNVAPSLRGRQGRILLAYLVLNRGKPVSRDELIASIWPDAPPADPPAALRTQLSRLRAAMGPAYLVGREMVELTLPDNAWVDIEAAERSISAAGEAIRAGDWKDAWAHGHIALNISGRPFMAGFDAPWVEEVRGELDELQMRARETIAQAGIGLGGSELAGAERSARAMIRHAPFRESGYLHLMRALVAAGNTAEALRTYDELRRLLAQELGSAPGAETQALHRRLLGGIEDEPAGRPLSDAPRGGRPEPNGIPLPSWLMPRRRSPFVGRAQELERLRRLWDGVQEGTAELVLVGGEPGVGKTRLATEFAQRAHSDGALVLYGRADEESGTELGPFAEALRHWAVNASPEELADDLGAHADLLSAHVPELVVRMDGVTAPAEEPERNHALDAFGGVLSAISARRATLLVVDDLQWADPASLLLLRRLARFAHRGRLLICATYRSGPSGALAETLAELGRERLVERVAIGGISSEETAALVASIRGAAIEPTVAAAIWEETGGNPFLVEALAEHMAATGDTDRPPLGGRSVRAALYQDGVPPLVREAVVHRVGTLGPIAVRAMEVAAVCGSDFSADFVNEVADLPPEDVIAALEAAVAAAVLVDVPGSLDRYAFAHSLLRQAIYTGIPKTRRASMHRRVAEKLEERHGNDPRHVAELASHFAAGGASVAPRALEYGVRAGASALGALAFDEAREHYERALKALDLTGSDDASLRCELLVALGEAEWRSGDRSASRDTYSRVLRIARRNGDADMLARAALGFAGFGWIYAGSGDGSVAATLSAALEAAPHSLALRARLNARLAEIVSMDGDREAAMRLASRAVDQARKAGDDEAGAQGLIAGWYAALAPADLPERRSLATALSDATGGIRDRDILTMAEVVQVLTSLELGDFTELDVAIARHRRLADQTKQPTARLHSRALLSMRALMEGRLTEAEGHTAEVLEVGELAGSPAALQTAAIQLLFLRWEQGRVAEMERAVGDLAERSRLWAAAHAFVLAEMRQRSRARAQLAELASVGFADTRRNSDWLGVMALSAAAAHAVRDEALAAHISEELQPYAGRVVAIGRGAAYAGSVSRYLGLLDGVAGDLDAAAMHLAEDIALNERAGALPWLARSRRDLASVLGKRGRSGDAERAGQLLAELRSDVPAGSATPR